MKTEDKNSIHLSYDNAAYTNACTVDANTGDRGYRLQENDTTFQCSRESVTPDDHDDVRNNIHFSLASSDNETQNSDLGIYQIEKNITSSDGRVDADENSPSDEKVTNGNSKRTTLMSYIKEKLLSSKASTDADNKEKELETGEEGRETWGKKIDFLLSVIGFAVDLGNVWRFPYICYNNGGGAFLVPYLLMLVFLGLPLFYMELALGQYQKCGAISVWNRICPVFSGVGYGICLVSTFVGMYYNTIIAWGVFYMFASFRSEVPWAGCNNSWNTENCMSLTTNFNKSLITNFTLTASDEYYTNEVLGVQGHYGIEDIGAPRWQLVLSLAAVFFIVYFSIWKGIKSSGKAVWITATVPYVVLIILLIRGCTLPGSVEGIKYYITPVWGKLLNEQVWIDAASQIFFSLGPGFGTLLALASYNNFHNNCYYDAIAVSIINCMTSFLAGFVVFAVLGYMAQAQGVTIENLPTNGPGLVFVVYPEVIATLDGSVFWSIIFFLMLITLGLDSTFGGLEAVITAICDEYPLMKRNRELFVLGLVLVCFLGALPTVTNGGQYVINLLDNHAAPISLLFICFIEAIAVNWFYGCQKFSNDIESMLGHQPGIFWKICWVGICPICLLILFVLSCWKYEWLTLMGYVYPPWAVALGWCITASSIICIPVYGVYRFIITPGTLKQKVLRLIRPSVVSDHLVLNGGSYNKDSYSISMNQTNLSNSVTMESAISLKMNGDSHNA